MRTLFLLIAPMLIVVGCGTDPKKGPAQPGTMGKYYSDDGPPEKVPENLAQIPDDARKRLINEGLGHSAASA